MFVALAAGACGSRSARLDLPAGAGRPWPEAVDAWAASSAGCRGVRTISAEVGFSGRAGREAIRGRALVGLAPDALRLEGVAPFGPPAFILVSRADRTTLLLSREPAVLEAHAAAPVLEALVGVDLSPDDLRAALSGCVVPLPEARAGRAFDAATAAVDLAGGATAFLKRQPGGAWRVFAARRADWQIEYTWGGARLPDRVRLWRAGSVEAAPVDVSAALSQVDVNIDLGDEVFRVVVPQGARPMSVEDLRAAGPLGDRSRRPR